MPSAASQQGEDSLAGKEWEEAEVGQAHNASALCHSCAQGNGLPEDLPQLHKQSLGQVRYIWTDPAALGGQTGTFFLKDLSQLNLHFPPRTPPGTKDTFQMDHLIPTRVTPDHGPTAQLPVVGTATWIHTPGTHRTCSSRLLQHFPVPLRSAFGVQGCHRWLSWGEAAKSASGGMQKEKMTVCFLNKYN